MSLLPSLLKKPNEEETNQQITERNVFFENSELDSLAKHFVNMHR